jgi:hypothetical protein
MVLTKASGLELFATYETASGRTKQKLPIEKAQIKEMLFTDLVKKMYS